MFLDTKQAAEHIGISESYLEKERAAGRFPAPAKSKWYTRAQLDDYVSQCETYGEWTFERYQQFITAKREQFVAAR